MKSTMLLLLILGSSSVVIGQLKVKAKCATFVVDILDGKVNGIKPDYTMGEIKTRLPCFTSTEEEGSSSKCGGGIFYKDQDVYFYTQRDYIEVGPKFKGKLSIPIMGADRKGLFKWLGNPKMKDDTWDAFEMNYGTLVLHYTPAGKVRLIQFSTKGMDTLNLCE